MPETVEYAIKGAFADVPVVGVLFQGLTFLLFVLFLVGIALLVRRWRAH